MILIDVVPLLMILIGGRIRKATMSTISMINILFRNLSPPLKTKWDCYLITELLTSSWTLKFNKLRLLFIIVITLWVLWYCFNYLFYTANWIINNKIIWSLTWLSSSIGFMNGWINYSYMSLYKISCWRRIFLSHCWHDPMIITTSSRRKSCAAYIIKQVVKKN